MLVAWETGDYQKQRIYVTPNYREILRLRSSSSSSSKISSRSSSSEISSGSSSNRSSSKLVVEVVLVNQKQKQKKKKCRMLINISFAYQSGLVIAGTDCNDFFDSSLLFTAKNIFLLLIHLYSPSYRPTARIYFCPSYKVYSFSLLFTLFFCTKLDSILSHPNRPAFSYLSSSIPFFQANVI